MKKKLRFKLSLIIALVLVFGTFTMSFADTGGPFLDSASGRHLIREDVLKGLSDGSLRYENIYIQQPDGNYKNVSELDNAEIEGILTYMEENDMTLEELVEDLKDKDMDVILGISEIIEELVEVVESKPLDEIIDEAPEPEPELDIIAMLRMIADPDLNEGFNLVRIIGEIRNAEYAHSYAIKYSVEDEDGEITYVTTEKARIGQENPDLIQYIDGETELVVYVYDIDDDIIDVIGMDRIEIEIQ